MHELSIAYNLVQISETAAREAGAHSVKTVHVRLGALAGVVKDALLFGYDIAVKGTLLAGSHLEIEELPVIIYCPACQQETTLTGIQHFACTHCGQPTADIRQGRELEIEYLEINDAAETS